MDVAMMTNRLVPNADYIGSLTANTETAYNAITWNDATTKPTWQELTDEQVVYDAEISNIRILIDAANISWDSLVKPICTITLGGNRTLDNPTNLVADCVYTLIIKQDATGNRTLTYGNVYIFPGGAPTLSTGANAIDKIEFYYDGINMYGDFKGNYS